jgi:(S)-2-hydroxyglutarate dehydrogenase
MAQFMLAEGEKQASMTYDIAIVGGGIVGLATGRELLRRHPQLRLVVLEKEAVLCKHQTGHNSGVIHSGIYYAPDSLKAKLCTRGRRALLEYCERKGIEYRLVGKLIVATDDSELPRLEDLMQRGTANAIEGLQMLDARGIAEREPHCRGIRAIFSPVTGIVDFGIVARSFGDDIRSAGGEIHTGRRLTSIERRGATIVLQTTGGEYEAKRVITCAGLQSDRLARLTGGKPDPKIVPFRGDYLILKPEKRYLVRGNIYPVPDPAFPFLGVHFTPRMNGEVWLGPNAVLAFAREGYSFGSINLGDLLETVTYPGFLKLASKYASMGLGETYRDLVRRAYVRALKRYIPELRTEDTLAGPSGVRAQAMMTNGALVDDFVFDGAPDVVHVRNAPSPAATSALAIGDYIADDAGARFGLGKAASLV